MHKLSMPQWDERAVVFRPAKKAAGAGDPAAHTTFGRLERRAGRNSP
jgi:hypothetical protein